MLIKELFHPPFRKASAGRKCVLFVGGNDPQCIAGLEIRAIIRVCPPFGGSLVAKYKKELWHGSVTLFAYLHYRYIVGSAMKSRVQKWGNSLALRIPKSFAKEA